MYKGQIDSSTVKWGAKYVFIILSFMSHLIISAGLRPMNHFLILQLIEINRVYYELYKVCSQTTPTASMTSTSQSRWSQVVLKGHNTIILVQGVTTCSPLRREAAKTDLSVSMCRPCMVSLTSCSSQ